MIEFSEFEPAADELEMYRSAKERWPQCKVVLGWSHCFDDVRDLSFCHGGMLGPAHIEFCSDVLVLSCYIEGQPDTIWSCNEFARLPRGTAPEDVLTPFDEYVGQWNPDDVTWDSVVRPETEEDED